MAVNPLKIIEQQLAYLEARSEKNLLNYDETVQLSTLVKAREFLKKAATSRDDTDPYAEMSVDELEALLGALK